MKNLTGHHFNRAVNFMKLHARKLEQRIFAYEFEGKPFGDVLNELEKYQNPDGGFGHGLEPDLRCEESSALATTRALEILQLSQEQSDQKKRMIKRALKYFEDTFREERFGWDIIPKAAENAPRAIWWEYGVFSDSWGNPDADIVGFFMDYKSIYSFGKLDDIVTHAIDYVNQTSDLKEMHELFCYIHLYDRLSEPKQTQIKDSLNTFMDNCVAKTSKEQQEYGATPIKVVDSPNASFYVKYADVIPGELDELMQQQAEDGAWEPDWSWYRFEEEWVNAKEEWKGVLTLDALRKLRNFDRLESRF